ncbi:MAG: hypothetical protein ACI9DC_003600 [Gammaproteobacteria bacterium]|jgi:hypothetical protein
MCAWRVVTTAALCCLVSAGAAALPPRIELDARMRTADGAIVDETIVPGAVLHSGDELRLRVTAWADGHLYVIALGSSGTAVLLHPFESGSADSAQRGTLSAPVRGGDAVSVPAGGGYLPLDDRIGQEMIVAFVADEPVESLTRLMFRMEGLFNEPAAAREILTSEGFELAHISFGHASQAIAIASTSAERSESPTLTAPSPPVASVVDSRASAEDLPATSAPAKVQQEGVLGGLGSQIAQFTGQPTAHRGETAPSTPATTPEEASLFSRWFGSGEKDEGDSPVAVAAEPEPPKAQEARTFALPQERPTTQQELPPRELVRALPPSANAAAETKPALDTRLGLQTTSDVPAPSASTHVALEEESSAVAATGRMVEPLPIEATLYPPGRRPTVSRTAHAVEDGSPDLRAGGSVQSTLSRLFTGELAGNQDEVKSAVASTAPQPVQLRTTGTAPDAAPAAIGESATQEKTENAVDIAAESLAKAGSASVQTEKVTHTSNPGAEGSTSEHDRQAAEAPGEVVISRSTDSAEQSDGWFSGLGALFSGGPPDEPSADEVTVEPEKSTASEPVVARTSSAFGQDTPLVVQPVETLTTDTQGGAVGASTGADDQASADSSSESDEPAVLSALGSNLPPVTSTARLRDAEAARSTSAVAEPVIQQQPVVRSEEVAKADDAGDGLLAGLSALLGGGATGEDKDKDQGDTQAATPQPESTMKLADVEERAPLVESPAAKRAPVESSEPAVLSALGRNLPPVTSLERSRDVESARPMSVVAEPLVQEPSTSQIEEVAKSDDARGGLFAGLSALLEGRTTGEDDTQTVTPQAGQRMKLADVDDRTQPAELPASGQFAAAPPDNAAGELPVSEAPAPVEERSQVAEALRPLSEAPASIENRVQVVVASHPQSAAESSEPITLSEPAQPTASPQESIREVALAIGGNPGADEVTGTGTLGVGQERQDDSSDSATGSGLYAGLGRLFGGNETSDASASAKGSVPGSDADVPVENARRIDVAVAQDVAGVGASDNESTEQSAVEPSGEGGLLAGLGALLTNPFASAEDGSPSTPSVQVQEPSRSSPQSVNTGNEPSIKRRVDRDGKQIVVLGGGPATRPEKKENQEVLGESGSRIRRLLDEPEPQTVAASMSEVETAAAFPEVSSVESPANAATTPVAPVRVAATPPPPPVPASVASVQPGPVQSALASGDDPVVISSTAPQQVALLTATPGKAVTALASVDVNSDGGVASSVVLVITPSGSTSGVLIDRNGHVLTNWHSVNMLDEVVVMFKQSQGSKPRRNDPARARVVAHSKFANLALLKVESVPAGLVPARVIAEVEMERGAPIHAIGHGGGRGGDGQWRHDIASLDRVRRSSSWYSAQRVLHRADVIRAEMDPVQDVTGAPLFNNQLELIGLGAMVRADKGEIVGVSAATIRAFLGGSS